MSIAGGHWYTSSGFWTPASGVIAVVIIGVITVWVAVRLAYPKRRLFYGISSDTPLLRQSSITGVEVRYLDRPLASPRAVTVTIRNAGRRDITREAFDGTPLELDLDQDIVECLDVETKPDDQPAPQVGKKGSVIAIEPVKIAGGETISINVLTDGEPPTLRKPKQTLIDVEIRPQPTVERTTMWITLAGGLVALVPILGATVAAATDRKWTGFGFYLGFAAALAILTVSLVARATQRNAT